MRHHGKIILQLPPTRGFYTKTMHEPSPGATSQTIKVVRQFCHQHRDFGGTPIHRPVLHLGRGGEISIFAAASTGHHHQLKYLLHEVAGLHFAQQAMISSATGPAAFVSHGPAGHATRCCIMRVVMPVFLPPALSPPVNNSSSRSYP